MAMRNQMFDLKAVTDAAKAVGQDIAKSREELERLINMIVKDKVIVKITKRIMRLDKDNRPILDPDSKKPIYDEIFEEKEMDCSIEDMISATLTLVLQDEKFRRNVPSAMVNQLMMASTTARNFEQRNLNRDLVQLRARVRMELVLILHKAYPAWNSLTGSASYAMLNALSQSQAKQGQLSNLPFGQTANPMTEM